MNEPAFPTHYTEMAGMSLRDYFAAKAMAALIICADQDNPQSAFANNKNCAKWAYEYADAMLDARKKEGK